jgi:uncharacterized membrane protein
VSAGAVAIPGFTLLDAGALAFFFLSWIAYGTLADRGRGSHSLHATVDVFRERWMREMVQRELRMLDALILANLVRGITFFASTAILLVGGLLALIGASELAVSALAAVPFAVPTPVALFQLKVLVLIGVFVYAFVKFVWAFRLTNYTSILLGAAPAPRPLDDETARYAAGLARLHGLGGRHFNQGLRANFFALAMLAWFLQPAAFLAATLLLLAVLWRRDFRSRSLKALRGVLEGTDPRSI